MESFEYPVCPNAPPVPAWDGWAEAAEDSTEESQSNGAVRAAGHVTSTNFEERLAEETRRALESGRERGREEGRRTEREALAPAAATEADAAAGRPPSLLKTLPASATAISTPSSRK